MYNKQSDMPMGSVVDKFIIIQNPHAEFIKDYLPYKVWSPDYSQISSCHTCSLAVNRQPGQMGKQILGGSTNNAQFYVESKEIIISQ